MDGQREIFRLSHVTKIFQGKEREVKAVDDVSLSIREGEIFGIIGMSGAGKSTLVRTLNRLEEISDGKISFDGMELGSLPERKLRQVRQSIGMIFQSFNLVTQKTVLDNVISPMRIAGTPRKERRERARKMLEVVGLLEKENAYPAQLSGGQRQRVAIARALAMNPRVLLCDEATSALDPKITDEILNLLKEINKTLNLTIILITHEMAVVEKICDRVAIIEKGRLEELGEVTEIFANPKSEAAKHLVLPGRQEWNPFEMTDKPCIRILFDGRAAGDPLIANLVKKTGETVNILCANTKTVGGVGFGQMIVELPKEKAAIDRITAFLKENNVRFHEITKEEATEL